MELREQVQAGLGFRVLGLGLMFSGLGSRVYGLGFRVEGLWIWRFGCRLETFLDQECKLGQPKP